MYKNTFAIKGVCESVNVDRYGDNAEFDIHTTHK